MSRLTWKHAHTEDDLAVARHNGRVARVFHNGTNYSFEVMTIRWWEQAQLGLFYDVIADGNRDRHQEACEAAEEHLCS